eukprot:GDKJ01019851.1.p1 GENE.GDKJ01019851.1~~GDKJ01019851.1.p1  ORF type:complete len:816 (+),score=198.53 GDKJ01019851.1:118-2448(+)
MKNLQGNKFVNSLMVLPSSDNKNPIYVDNSGSAKGVVSQIAGDLLAVVTENTEGTKVSTTFSITHRGTTLQNVHTGNTIHGAVDLGEYGGAVFNADASSLIYCAEVSPPKTLAFTDVSVLRGNPSDATGLGQNNVHRQTFGEQSNNAVRNELYEISLMSSSAEPIAFKTPSNYSMGHPRALCKGFAVCVGWNRSVDKLMGRVFCNNRSSSLFIVSSSQSSSFTPFDVLKELSIQEGKTGEEYSGVESPIVFYDAAGSEPGVKELFNIMCIAVPSPKSSNGDDNHRKNVHILNIQIVIDVKENKVSSLKLEHKLTSHNAFPPILHNQFVNSSFAPSKSALLFPCSSESFSPMMLYNIHKGSTSSVLLVSPDQNTTDLSAELENLFKPYFPTSNTSFLSYSFLTTYGQNELVVTASSPVDPVMIARVSINSQRKFEIVTPPTHINPPCALDHPLSRVRKAVNAALKSLKLVWVEDAEARRDFAIIPSAETVSLLAPVFPTLYSPASLQLQKENGFPLLENVHGGPHSCTTTDFILSNVFCALLNVIVLNVNYTGSIGFSDATSLPGYCGDKDVKYCIKIINTFKNETLKNLSASSGEVLRVDSSRVGVMGGSHGGFLSLHLLGQAPSVYKAACVRNPVTNLVSMISTTDIPDWVYYEATGQVYNALEHAPLSFEPAVYERMFASSPIAHVANVEGHLLLALGLKDQRVPSQQGFEYFRALKLRDQRACVSEEKHKLLVFPSSDHSLSEAETVSEWWPQTGVWIVDKIVLSLPATLEQN